jgi:hypothetical protein
LEKEIKLHEHRIALFEKEVVELDKEKLLALKSRNKSLARQKILQKHKKMKQMDKAVEMKRVCEDMLDTWESNIMADSSIRAITEAGQLMGNTRDVAEKYKLIDELDRDGDKFQEMAAATEEALKATSRVYTSSNEDSREEMLRKELEDILEDDVDEILSHKPLIGVNEHSSSRMENGGSVERGAGSKELDYPMVPFSVPTGTKHRVQGAYEAALA